MVLANVGRRWWAANGARRRRTSISARSTSFVSAMARPRTVASSAPAAAPPSDALRTRLSDCYSTLSAARCSSSFSGTRGARVLSSAPARRGSGHEQQHFSGQAVRAELKAWGGSTPSGMHGRSVRRRACLELVPSHAQLLCFLSVAPSKPVPRGPHFWQARGRQVAETGTRHLSPDEGRPRHLPPRCVATPTRRCDALRCRLAPAGASALHYHHHLREKDGDHHNIAMPSATTSRPTPHALPPLLSHSTAGPGAARRFLSASPCITQPEGDGTVSTASLDGSGGRFSIKGEAAPGRAAYLDGQATTPIDPRVLDVMMPYMVRWAPVHCRSSPPPLPPPLPSPIVAATPSTAHRTAAARPTRSASTGTPTRARTCTGGRRTRRWRPLAPRSPR